jgi:hypothetical protein
MKATTVFRNFLVFVGLLVLVTGCFDEDNFLAENIERTGEKYPVVSDLKVVSGRDTFQVGEAAQLDVRFWSEGTVASINVYDSLIVDGVGVRAQQQVASIDPSQAAFSEVSQTDSLIVEYTIPSSISDTTFVDLDVEVVNENGLSETNETANSDFAIGGFDIIVVP